VKAVAHSPMKRRTAALLMLLAGLHSPRSTAAQESPGTTGATSATETSIADGNGDLLAKSPALTGVRRPLYRLHKSDVVEVQFTFSPEFNQPVTVQPDGFVSLKGVPDLVAEGLTVSELSASVRRAYQAILRDPEVSVILKDFDKPYFLAGGQVGHPGKYELRSTTSVAEAVAIAGGFTDQSKHSQVVVFRRLTDGVVESHVLNMKAMLASRNLEEDLELKPGDMLFVPQNRISKIRKYLPASSLSTFFTPAQF
jgi:polysaccharide biosynthesis/export protein